MRLNEQIPDTQPPKATEAQKLLKSVLDKVTESLSVDIKPFPDGSLPESYKDFFDKYYIKPDIEGYFNFGQISSALSIIEADILNFICSLDAQSNPYLFIDYAGRGKTTILKYLCYYLFDKEEILSQHMLPVYISLRKYEATISQFTKASDLHDFFKKLIKEGSFNEIYEYFLRDPATPLNWINKHYHSRLQGHFPPPTIEHISKAPDGYIEYLSHDHEDRLIELIFGLLCYFSRNEIRVTLFLDDADNFSIDIQRALLDFANQAISSGLSAIVALRVSTWITLESDRRDWEPYVTQTKINWSLSSLKNLLTIRLTNAKETIILQDKSVDVIAQKEDVSKAFINLLANDQTADFLIRTSNYNLHSLMRKLASMPDSWHFEDKYLVKELLLSRAKDKSHGVRLWTVFNLILGTYRGTFHSKDDTARNGLINCFCTRYDKHEPYTFFVRVHILTRLRDARTEGESIAISELREEYRQIFGNNLSFSRVFKRTLYRLVQGVLLILSLAVGINRRPKLMNILKQMQST